MRDSYLGEEIERNNTKEFINIKIQHRQYPKYVKTKQREILKDVFTPKQIERLNFKNKKRTWREDDDNSSFNFKEMVCLPDTQKELLSVLKGRSLSRSSRERLTVLSFDEMRVDTRMCYDQREDR
ncbi:hypothetical protein PR048_033669 [Dryococelus australis]|uniref:Uncharacterized protein n=1 Tax=Dryococelus australis TaxID=614101 RepID=A0ABQ9G0X6_9NEOP|nr:hypothetical protein PR048_033669 [Dryococelus australis]